MDEKITANGKRLQVLFEGCCVATLKSTKLDFTKDLDGTYSEPRTEQLYCLWLSGHGQGVVDHAVERGDIEL